MSFEIWGPAERQSYKKNETKKNQGGHYKLYAFYQMFVI